MEYLRIFTKRSLIIFLFLFFQQSSLFAQNIKVKIIETSDVHGAIYPYNFTADRSSSNSLAQVHSYVKGQRSQSDQEIILIDNGDILQGDPSVYYYNFENTNTEHLYAKVMNYMKYDAATVGNHDIEPGHSVYDKFKDELNFPWLAANAINTQTNKPYFQPYHIIERRGIKIAVLGLITPGIPNWLPENIWSGIEFKDMIQTAKKWVPIIQERENPDLLIGLFHAGVDYTYDNQTKEMPQNENASELVAEQVPGFDIVFVGHDHQTWNYKIENIRGDSVLILGPSSRARKIAEAEIDFTFNKTNEAWESEINGKLIDIQNIRADSLFLATFNEEFIKIKEFVSRPIGEFTETISARESLFGNSSFVDLIHKIQLQLSDAEISFTAPLSLHAKISEGKIYVRDMF
ncbi:MAG: metallophosphoesterase, partial [Melioribacteraceae bacterium]|nr:metallophosphoesterase [Melioribacteraceae bacterium]